MEKVGVWALGRITRDDETVKGCQAEQIPWQPSGIVILSTGIF